MKIVELLRKNIISGKRIRQKNLESVAPGKKRKIPFIKGRMRKNEMTNRSKNQNESISVLSEAGVKIKLSLLQLSRKKKIRIHDKRKISQNALDLLVEKK
jgi:hypothetical protein